MQAAPIEKYNTQKQKEWGYEKIEKNRITVVRKELR
jgi:hypothetical protein